MSLSKKRRGYVVEGIVSDPTTWKPVANVVNSPSAGVILGGGMFERCMRENIEYLLTSFSADHMLYHFRKRSGQGDPPGGEKLEEFWDCQLQGSNAGRFLMGAGNTLCWIEHPALRRMMDEVVGGIRACVEDSGYMYAFPPEEMIHGAPGIKWVSAQQSNYARSWITLGLLAVARAGNPEALPLIRGGQDWFNGCEYLPEITNVLLWYQGHIANTSMHFSPAGRQEDITVAERYYVANHWLDRLRADDLAAIWQDGLNAVHLYLVTAFQAYLDHYRATGDRRFLEGVLKGWEMFRSHWEHPGGSIALCEGGTFPPDSLYIHPDSHTGETCGSAFWVKLNQQLHVLYPDREVYVAEIEKSVWNVLLANHRGINGSAYHTHLEGTKQGKGRAYNTCCEGQATRLIGSLPEFIYSVGSDGVHVNLFEPSTFEWTHDGHAGAVEMTTGFPANGDCRLRVVRGGAWRLHLRIPGWSAGHVDIRVNDETVKSGRPGSYVALERTWRDGDIVAFTLPMEFRVTPYSGMDHMLKTQYTGLDRVSIEYGPFLMAVAGPRYEDAKTSFCDYSIAAVLEAGKNDVSSLFEPVVGESLHFTIRNHPEYRLLPYWQIPEKQTFTCFPVVV